MITISRESLVRARNGNLHSCLDLKAEQVRNDDKIKSKEKGVEELFRRKKLVTLDLTKKLILLLLLSFCGIKKLDYMIRNCCDILLH